MFLRIAASTSIGIFLATSAVAQVEIAQQDDQWFTDAEARLEIHGAHEGEKPRGEAVDESEGVGKEEYGSTAERREGGERVFGVPPRYAIGHAERE